jgi:MFS family permease
MMTAANSTIQMSTDPVVRGRVMALYMIVFLGATPVGSPVIGWVGETFGPRWAIGVGSISALLVSTGAAIWAARAWHVQVRYHVTSRPHVEVLHLDVPVGVGADRSGGPDGPDGTGGPGGTGGRPGSRGHDARLVTANRLGAQEAADQQSAA